MKQLEPYRLFFPIGWLLGFIGVLIWVPWIFHPLFSYPGLIHPELMIGGFLLLYSFGFLTTAIPRFTATQDMSMTEKKLALLLFGFLLLGFAIASKAFIFSTDICLVLFVMGFAAKRIQKRNSEPPPSFIFVGFGLALALFGSGFQLLGTLDLINADLMRASRPLFYEGFMLSLVLGIGSRLIPGILGHQPALVPRAAGPEQATKKSFISLWTQLPNLMKIVGIIFLASFAIDLIFMTPIYGDILRALICLVIGIKIWQLHRRPKIRGVISNFLWLSGWSMMLSLILMAILPTARLHVVHLLYISGFGLMTIMVSTRVTLSHSGQDLTAEKRSTALLTTGLFLVAAALARVTGYFVPEHYNHFLLCACTLWCLGLLCWIGKFGLGWFKIMTSK